MKAPIVRPNIKDAKSAQQAYDEARSHFMLLLDEAKAQTELEGGLDVEGDWGYAGDYQHKISLLIQILREGR